MMMRYERLRREMVVYFICLVLFQINFWEVFFAGDNSGIRDGYRGARTHAELGYWLWNYKQIHLKISYNNKVKLKLGYSYVVVRKRMTPKRSGTTRRCGLVGVGLTFLEEFCHCGCGLWGLLCLSYVQRHSSSLVAADQDMKLSFPTSAPFLPARCYVPSW